MWIFVGVRTIINVSPSLAWISLQQHGPEADLESLLAELNVFPQLGIRALPGDDQGSFFCHTQSMETRHRGRKGNEEKEQLIVVQRDIWDAELVVLAGS